MAERERDARSLLGRLRDIMAGGGSPQVRLDLVTALIARGLGTDVCSCYVLRAGEVLELFATEGLSQAAVHKTRLRVSEGLIGEVAATGRALTVADAWSHPNFAYRPETGEDLFQSLMGVPMIRGGRVIGVLAVQNRESRDYEEFEQEILETVAMVLAEMLAGADLVGKDELGPVAGNAVLPMRLEGDRLNGGIGLGTAVYHRPEVMVHRLVGDDPETEMERLRTALSEMRQSIDSMLALHRDVPGEYHDVLETFRMFAEDAGWIGRISEHIQTGLSAEGAVRKVDDDMRLRMSQVSDPYIRERLHDLEDLANRLLRHLTGDGSTAALSDLPEHVVLICRSLGPAELLDYDPSRLRGVIMEEGSSGMHAVIVAKALDIPVIGRVPDVFQRVAPLDQVVVDGDHGHVFVRPGEDVREAFLNGVLARKQRRAFYQSFRDQPAVSRDGYRIKLMINAGLLFDMEGLVESGADGVGLYRTEIPFMARPSLPSVETQTELYDKVLELAGDKPVTFRTLDVGGDKLLPYWNRAPEDNPAMGWRSIRITLDRPAILREQLRALIRASGRRELRVMFPMVANVAEFRAARKVLMAELAREAARGTPPPRRVRIGTMLEVPSLIWQLPALLKDGVDFISVGSNDLMQFTFAADRANSRLAGRYDPLSPAALSILHRVVTLCDAAAVPLSLCGEMASRPLDAMALVALGFRFLSVAAPGVGPVKQMLLSTNIDQVRPYVETLLDLPDASVRENLRSFALDHGISLS
ncbi:phosphoenolpyruvate--protein phosphotransferase [Rhodospirillum rubrum]|uniref:phosphoenolpyruvate--protein phosphotransferase n=1 Tax=Rhodospirillum rubrum TaxID=1085 RepID=UPI001905DFDB|nr:phosphoenolpyruvate--protein phosphotransferase [Rhodospirillum rubrum]MBK1663631.1 phosphoenolpyruvate--protein phosphotransferase [Rhodospirillum rubrum]MBK1676987.1 phosphoenolpyruvate--protein phosphotransferase [Rhodospirillum rubrum]